MILTNLQKAFDTINHDISLKTRPTILGPLLFLLYVSDMFQAVVTPPFTQTTLV